MSFGYQLPILPKATEEVKGEFLEEVNSLSPLWISGIKFRLPVLHSWAI